MRQTSSTAPRHRRELRQVSMPRGTSYYHFHGPNFSLLPPRQRHLSLSSGLSTTQSMLTLNPLLMIPTRSTLAGNFLHICLSSNSNVKNTIGTLQMLQPPIRLHHFQPQMLLPSRPLSFQRRTVLCSKSVRHGFAQAAAIRPMVH